MKAILPFILLCQSAWAQSFTEDPSGVKARVLRSEGQLISIQIVRKQPLKIYVVGKEEARLDLKNLKLTVRRINPFPAETLRLDRNGNYFSVAETPGLILPQEIEVTSHLNDNEEVFHFNLKNQYP